MACGVWWACAAFGWQVLVRIIRLKILVGWQVQEHGWVVRKDDATEMVDVLLNPRQVRGFSVETIGILRKAVSLQGMRESDVGVRNLEMDRNMEVSRGRVSHDRLTGSLPTAVP